MSERNNRLSEANQTFDDSRWKGNNLVHGTIENLANSSYMNIQNFCVY